MARSKGDDHSESEKKEFHIDDKDDQGTTCLMKAAINGYVEIVELLLTFGANPRVCNRLGETALTMAVLEKKIKVCEKLLVARADVNHRDLQGRSSVHKAARTSSNTDILQLLLQYGADPNIADFEQNSPLHFAAIRGTK